MLEAIGSLLSKTFDVFLKLNSKDARKRQLGKMLFGVYSGLGRVTVALENLHQDLSSYVAEDDDNAKMYDIALPKGLYLKGWSSDAGYKIESRHFDANGNLHLDDSSDLTKEQLIALSILRHIDDFSSGVDEFTQLLTHEASAWFQLGHQPKRLQALGIYDEEIVRLYSRAWFLDGGFVGALRGLGFEAQFSAKVIRLTDATFDPTSSRHGYEISPTVREFDLTKSEDVSALLHLIKRTQETARDAQESLKRLLKDHFSLEDFL